MMVVGTPGGSRIITAVLHTILNVDRLRHERAGGGRRAALPPAVAARDDQRRAVRAQPRHAQDPRRHGPQVRRRRSRRTTSRRSSSARRRSAASRSARTATTAPTIRAATPGWRSATERAAGVGGEPQPRLRPRLLGRRLTRRALARRGLARRRLRRRLAAPTSCAAFFGATSSPRSSWRPTSSPATSLPTTSSPTTSSRATSSPRSSSPADLAAFLARLGQADRDRLLAARHLLAGAAALQRAVLALVHRLLRPCPAPSCHTLPWVSSFLGSERAHDAFGSRHARSDKAARSTPRGRHGQRRADLRCAASARGPE